MMEKIMRLIFIILATIVASSFCEYPMLKYSCKEEFGYFNNIKYYGILPNEVGSQDVISKKSSTVTTPTSFALPAARIRNPSKGSLNATHSSTSWATC